MTIRMTGHSAVVPIDPQFVEVCHTGTLQVCSAQPDLPFIVGASVVDGGYVRVLLDRPAVDQVNIVVRLTAIRKGFIDKRFPNRTKEQFLANERHIRSAYPGAGE